MHENPVTVELCLANRIKVNIAGLRRGRTSHFDTERKVDVFKLQDKLQKKFMPWSFHHKATQDASINNHPPQYNINIPTTLPFHENLLLLGDIDHGLVYKSPSAWVKTKQQRKKEAYLQKAT